MKKRNQETGKKWLFKEILNGYGQGSGLLFLPSQILIHVEDYLNNDYVLLFGCLIVVALALMQYIVLVIIPKKAEQYLIETYPEYEFSK
jgi:hypothetical protein